MAKVIEMLTEPELMLVRLEAIDILVANHQAEYERIRKGIEFNARQAKADKKDRDK